MSVAIKGFFLFLVPAALAALSVAQSQAQSTSYQPSETEWATWPEYCQARFVVSAAGRTSRFASRVPPADTQQWQDRLGAGAWRYLHHYCAALLFEQRAATAESDSQRAHLLRSAVAESQATLERTPASSPFYAFVSNSLARGHYALGDAEQALDVLARAIQAHPAIDQSYLLRARIERAAGRERDAFETLQLGVDATGGQSAELHYALGLAYYRQQEYERSRHHAEAAYDAGYPLPFLRDELRRLGHWDR